MKNATDAMKESRISDLIASLNALQYRRMDFEEFCAAALSVHQLEALDLCEQHAQSVSVNFLRGMETEQLSLKNLLQNLDLVPQSRFMWFSMTGLGTLMGTWICCMVCPARCL
ncbi:hypothetical protein ACE6H2_027255 [Prunus campanulata]